MNNLKHNTKHKNPNALKCEADNGLHLGEFLFNWKPNNNKKVNSWLPFSLNESSELPLIGRIMAGDSAQTSMPIVSILGSQKHKGSRG